MPMPCDRGLCLAIRIAHNCLATESGLRWICIVSCGGQCGPALAVNSAFDILARVVCGIHAVRAQSLLPEITPELPAVFARSLVKAPTRHYRPRRRLPELCTGPCLPMNYGTP